jgi:hypothetical protein
MLSNAQRCFTLAIAAALCIYAASASSAPDSSPNAAHTSASDVAPQDKPIAAQGDADNAHDVPPARPLTARAPAMRPCPH